MAPPAARGRGRLLRGWARACARSVRAVYGGADTGWACTLLGCDRRRVRSGRAWNEMCDGGGHRSQADAAKTWITTAVVWHPALAGAANGHRGKRGRGKCEGERASLVNKPRSRCRTPALEVCGRESLEIEGTRAWLAQEWRAGAARTCWMACAGAGRAVWEARGGSCSGNSCWVEALRRRTCGKSASGDCHASAGCG